MNADDLPPDNRSFGITSHSDATPHAPPAHTKRTKSFKTCNACSQQKRYCEKLVGDTDRCHRCYVIGIPCVYDREPSSVSTSKTLPPRHTLPRNEGSPSGMQAESPGSSRLHVLASATELASRETHASSPHSIPSHLSSQSPPTSVTTTREQSSTDAFSIVGSTVFTAQLDPTSEGEMARFQADWKCWIAPLTQLQTLVRKISRAEQELVQPPPPQNGTFLSTEEEVNLKHHFLVNYSPWLPTVCLGQNGSLDEVSPFLSVVICATAARTFNGIAQSTMDRLRSVTLHYVGLTFADPSAYPLVESLYALLILIFWPLDIADNGAVLMQGAKRMARSPRFGDTPSMANERPPETENIDHIRLWYTIWANETIVALGSGAIVPPPDMDDFTRALGTGSQIALQNGDTSDILLALEINLLKIITEAMGDRPFSFDKNTARTQNTPDLVHKYMSAISVFLTRLTHWEIEFSSIENDCSPEVAVYYAVLEIKYHYLSLMFVVHASLMLSYVYPMYSAPQNIRFNIWSWCLTINKSALAVTRIFNKYSFHSHALGVHTGYSPSLAPFMVAPDRIFAMVVLVIMLLFRHQVLVAEYSRRRGYPMVPLGGFTQQADLAIRRLTEHMRQIGHAKGALRKSYHPAAKYVNILDALLHYWDEKRAHGGDYPPGGVYEDYEDDELTLKYRSMSGSSVGVAGAGVGGFGHGNTGVVNPSENNLEPLMQTTMSADQDVTGPDPGMGQGDIDLDFLGGNLVSDITTLFSYPEAMEDLEWATAGLWSDNNFFTGDFGVQ